MDPAQASLKCGCFSLLRTLSASFTAFQSNLTASSVALTLFCQLLGTPCIADMAHCVSGDEINWQNGASWKHIRNGDVKGQSGNLVSKITKKKNAACSPSLLTKSVSHPFPSIQKVCSNTVSSVSQSQLN